MPSFLKAAAFVVFFASGTAGAVTYDGEILTFSAKDNVLCREVGIEKGDRVWSLARRYAREYFPHVPIAEVGSHVPVLIREIGYLNEGIDLDKIKEGDSLCFPLPFGFQEFVDLNLQRLDKVAGAGYRAAEEADHASELLTMTKATLAATTDQRDVANRRVAEAESRYVRSKQKAYVLFLVLICAGLAAVAALIRLSMRRGHAFKNALP